MKERRLITAALPYTNNIPHIGNIVGSHLPADIFARYCRLSGYDTVFIGGTDEHGTPISLEAKKLGVTPKELADKFFIIHKRIYNWFNFSYDNFSRTSRKIHHDLAQEFFIEFYKKGYLIEKELELPYCLDCNAQLSDRYIKGECPDCGYKDARGDQCEKCSRVLDPIDLINPVCAICGKKHIKFKKVKHLFLDLTKFSSKLKKWLISNKQMRKQVKDLALAWIKEGLKPRCVTRDLEWGITMPVEGYENMKIYVWAEAAIGYISSTKEWNKQSWEKYWKNKNSKTYYFIGKDNIPFHTILFPAELLARSYNLPYNVIGLQYLNYERSKFSKSKGHGVFCENLPNVGLDEDYWRFYLSFVIPETKDTEFLWNDFQNRINSELVGNFGNFINRTLSFIDKNFDRIIPESKIKDNKFIKKVEKQVDLILGLYEKVELRKSLDEILRLSSMSNTYFQENEPWKTKDKEVIFICGNLCKILALLLLPFIPKSSTKVLNMLNCEEKNWKKIKEFNLKSHKINKPEILFNKLDDKMIEKLKVETSKIKE